MAVTTEDGELVMQDPLSQESGIVTGTGEEVDEVEEEAIEMQDLKIETVTSNASKSSQNSQSDPKLQKEMETCFGFDEVSVMFCVLYVCVFSNFKLFFVKCTCIYYK